MRIVDRQIRYYAGYHKRPTKILKQVFRIFVLVGQSKNACVPDTASFENDSIHRYEGDLAVQILIHAFYFVRKLVMLLALDFLKNFSKF